MVIARNAVLNIVSKMVLSRESNDINAKPVVIGIPSDIEAQIMMLSGKPWNSILKA